MTVALIRIKTAVMSSQPDQVQGKMLATTCLTHVPVMLYVTENKVQGNPH